MKVDTEEEKHTMRLLQLLTAHLAAWTDGAEMPRLQVPAATNLGDLVNPQTKRPFSLKERELAAESPYLPLKFKGRMNPQGNMCWL